MDRKKCLVSNTIGEMLVKQIAHELKNYDLYKSFANYFDVEGVADLATYFNKRADEEKNHHEWCISYLTDANYKVLYPAIEVNTVKIENYSTPFDATIEREIETTQLIYKIYEQAISEKDYMTAAWLLEKLIKEQHEEESISLSASDIIKQDSDIFLKAEKVLELLEN